MLLWKPSGLLLTALTCAALLQGEPLAAQDGSACLRSEANDGPSRQIFTCGDAITFEREPEATLQIIERSDAAAPRAIELQGGAILIEVSPGSLPTQIRTPHAIATVRGTKYVVDAETDQTSVFVIEGSVIVSDAENASTVTLAPGEGVDVVPDTPLEVQTWGAARVTDLLARFGR